jgi:hypothetical protein
MAKSGYVLAGFETLATILDNFIAGRRGRYNDNFSRKDISKFLSSNLAGFLHSFGQDFPNKKKYDKYNLKESTLYHKCRDMGIFDGCTLISDSGGYQISIGRLSRRESELLYNMYYDWLVKYKDSYDRSFILDIPPGPNCKIFHNFEDVYNKNLDSYKRAQNLPDDVRKKIIYIHHFRTPKLWQIYTKIMRENNMFGSFEYHATGGVVANMASDMIIPCIIYVLPLIPLINEAKMNNRNYLNFHILGGSNFRDILFYELFTKVIREKHNFTVNITYDSSGVYKQVMHARFIYVKDEWGYYRKMNIKSNNLNMKFTDKLSVMTIYEQVLNDFARQYGFKEVSLDGVYDPSRDTFWEDIKVYSILYTFHLYATIQQEMQDFANRVYPLYESGDLKTFYEECFEVIRTLNQGNITRKQKTKAHSIPRSLDMLSTLDEDMCYAIVDRYLSKDEFSDLDEDTAIWKMI